MSCNKFYPGYYGCAPYYNKCEKKCKKKSKCKCDCDDSCETDEYVCYNPCVEYQYVLPQPVPVNACPPISYITTAPTGTTIPSGSVPTTIGSFSTGPSINSGTGNTFYQNAIMHIPAIHNNSNIITLNTTNNYFTVPVTGRYLITATIGFVESGVNNGIRILYINKVNNSTVTSTVLAEDSRNAVTIGDTYISITTVGDLTAGDSIYFSVSQTNTSVTTITTTANGRFSISRLC